MNKWEKIRADYPVCNNYTYIGTNGGGPVSTPYVQKAQQLLTELSEKGRGVMATWDPQLLPIRKLVAKMIHADASEIAFITNTSQAMGLLTGMFPKEYEIITMRDEFPSSFVPWLHLGYQVHFAESNAAGEITVSDIEKKITPGTRILITSHVLFRTGFRQHLPAIGELCKKHGLIHIVDATQSFGVNDIDVAAANIDILIFHGYKWVTAGYGAGAMYVSRKITAQYPPQQLGWYSVEYAGPDFNTVRDYTQFTPKPDATVFELGTPPFLNILLLGSALEYIETAGVREIEAYIQHLISYLHKKAAENNIHVLTAYAPPHLSAIQRLDITAAQYKKLEEKNIVARYKNDMLTLALNFYNNEADIDALFAALK